MRITLMTSYLEPIRIGVEFGAIVGQYEHSLSQGIFLVDIVLWM